MSSSERAIEFRGHANGRRMYSFSVRDGMVTTEGDAVYPYDRVSTDGTHASGVVSSGTDSYRFTGEVKHIFVDPDIEVALDGDVIEPQSLVEADAEQQEIPELVAEKVDMVAYDGEYLDIGGAVRFHWQTAWDIMTGGSGGS